MAAHSQGHQSTDGEHEHRTIVNALPRMSQAMTNNGLHTPFTHFFRSLILRRMASQISPSPRQATCSLLPPGVMRYAPFRILNGQEVASQTGFFRCLPWSYSVTNSIPLFPVYVIGPHLGSHGRWIDCCQGYVFTRRTSADLSMESRKLFSWEQTMNSLEDQWTEWLIPHDISTLFYP